ncbi:MAG: hypothetical protein JWO05_3382 [Gemmatimonadetes bacterium]|nr:hypothetical protein [Gemmatimonadota bacterium]
MYVASGILLVLSAWSVLARPEIIWGPAPESVAPAQDEYEAQARAVMWLQAQRLFTYRFENGVLPQKLQDAGDPYGAFIYHRWSDSTFELKSADVRMPLTLRSEELGDFLRSGSQFLHGEPVKQP